MKNLYFFHDIVCQCDTVSDSHMLMFPSSLSTLFGVFNFRKNIAKFYHVGFLSLNKEWAHEKKIEIKISG